MFFKTFTATIIKFNPNVHIYSYSFFISSTIIPKRYQLIQAINNQKTEKVKSELKRNKSESIIDNNPSIYKITKIFVSKILIDLISFIL